MVDTRTGYKLRVSKPKLWRFRQVCMANQKTMQRVLETYIDQVIDEYVAGGGIIPPCPYPEEPEAIDLTTFKEVVAMFGDDLIDAGFTKPGLNKLKSGAVLPTEREYKVISKVSGLAIEHLKELP